MERHYYRYVGDRWFDERIREKRGYIFKCLTTEDAKRKYRNSGEVWEKVEVFKNGERTEDNEVVD